MPGLPRRPVPLAIIPPVPGWLPIRPPESIIMLPHPIFKFGVPPHPDFPRVVEPPVVALFVNQFFVCGAAAWASASCGGASCISASCPGATWLEAVSWPRWAGASWQDEKVFNTKGCRSGGGAAPWPEAGSRFGSCAASWGSGAASWPEAVSSCMAASIDDAAPTVGELSK